MQLKDEILACMKQSIVTTKGRLDSLFAGNYQGMEECPIALQELEEEEKIMKIYPQGVSPERAAREQTYYALHNHVFNIEDTLVQM